MTPSANVVHFSMPEGQEVIPEGYFQEGEAVVYHSRTQSAYLRTRITKIHIVRGVVKAIDLSCKKSADLSKIAKIESDRESVLAELPLPLHAENAERRRADTGDVGVLEAHHGGVGSVRNGSKVLQKSQHPETQSPNIRFEVGDKVLYNSTSLKQKLVATVEGITADGHYDLDVKKSADPKNISPYVVLAELPLPLHAENAERRRADTGDVGVLEAHHGGVGSVRNGSKVLQKSQHPETQSPNIRFEVGDKVLYNSTSLKQKLVATVEGITADGHYDLDVKKSADPKNISPYVVLAESAYPLNNAETRRVEAEGEARVHDDRMSPVGRFCIGDKVLYNSTSLKHKLIATVEGITPDGHYDLDVKKSADPKNISPYVEHQAAVHLPIKHVRADSVGTQGWTPRGSNGATPVGFDGAAEFVASRYTGEGRIVSCKAFAAVPIGPSPTTRTPTPVRSTPGSTPRICTTPKAPSAAVMEMVKQLCGEIHCTDRFVPSQGMIRRQLLQQLNLRETAQIQEMGGFKGGLNQGIWIVSDNGQKLVLKQSRCQRIASNILTEAENFVRILKDHPEITNDPLVAFPVKIFSCLGPEGKLSDIIAMKKSPGERLCEFVAAKFYANQIQQLNNAMEEVGNCLAQFHFRYGNEQHGDFQPSNIYYEEMTNVVTFIDVGGMGDISMDTDVEHFHHCVRAMTASYQVNLHAELLRAFDKGYQSATPDCQRNVSVHFGSDPKLLTDRCRFGNLIAT